MIEIAYERKSQVFYQGNGTQTQYQFPFDYLRKAFVKVQLISSDSIVELVQGTDYSVSDKVLTLVNPTDFKIQIYRETTTKPLVEWQDASILKASDLSLQEIQLLHLMEEAMDKLLDNAFVLSTTVKDAWDARFKRIINLLDPVDDGDAVTLGYLKENKSAYIKEIQDTAQRLLDQINATGDKYNSAPAVDEIKKMLEQTKAYAEWAEQIKGEIIEMSDGFDPESYWTKKESDNRYLKKNDVVEATEKEVADILKE